MIMVWDIFIYFAIAAVVLYAAGSVVAWMVPSKERVLSGLSGKSACREKIAASLSGMAMLVFGAFIVVLWSSLSRPPMRTLGETRLWYSFFAMAAGLFTYIRWKYNWVISFSAVLSTVFIVINCLKPQIHDATLMPALQSGWFIPHVTVYMFSYSILGCAFLIALRGLVKKDETVLQSIDTLVYIGLAFLSFGMLSGAVWAKQAWGDFWTWDPKETWAAITWLSYLAYIHFRLLHKGSLKWLCILVIFSFACLQMCWWGVNYLPSAQDSVHVYGR